ncbi:ATP-binding protein [Deinococcus sp. AJ005]|uniref:ATP-binding protein n=1 Tax=Deinococcus sp. AJ005 TaxID=2652443 RepID=UPI00351B5062
MRGLSVEGAWAEGLGMPYRSPHHTVWNAGLRGGAVARFQSEVSLSHKGEPFLDECPEVFFQGVLIFPASSTTLAECRHESLPVRPSGKLKRSVL